MPRHPRQPVLRDRLIGTMLDKIRPMTMDKDQQAQVLAVAQAAYLMGRRDEREGKPQEIV